MRFYASMEQRDAAEGIAHQMQAEVEGMAHALVRAESSCLPIPGSHLMPLRGGNIVASGSVRRGEVDDMPTRNCAANP